jgi:hypothetical protein
MSYEPSTRRLPRQERWPDATPQRGWPAYSDNGAYRDGDLYEEPAAQGRRGRADGGYGGSWDGYSGADYGQASYGQAGYGQDSGRYGQQDYGQPRDDHGWPHNAYRGTASGYAGAADDFDGPVHGYDGQVHGFDGAASGPPWIAEDYAGGRADRGWDGHAENSRPWDRHGETDRGWDGYGETDRGWDGYGETDRGWDGYGEADRGWDGYGEADRGYRQTGDDLAGPAGYTRPQPAGPVLVAPDLVGDAGWPAGRGQGRDPARSGVIAAAMCGILAAAVAVGVATLAAAFVRPQASPVAALGGVLVDRIPSALRNVALQHFGTHGKTVLLLGVIGVIAVVIGWMARRSAAIGVAGLAALGLLGAFVVITRPASHASDVIPSIAGGLVGVIAFAWLARAAAPIAPPLRPVAGGRRVRR